jgi:hypothetical protein
LVFFQACQRVLKIKLHFSPFVSSLCGSVFVFVWKCVFIRNEKETESRRAARECEKSEAKKVNSNNDGKRSFAFCA